LKNLLTSFYFFFIRAVCSVVQLRFLNAHFGNQLSGLNALLNQVYLYVTLFELGLAAAAVSLLYEPIQKNDTRHASELIATLHRDTVRLTLAAAPIIYSVLAVYALRMRTSLSFSTVFAALALTAASGLCVILSLAYQSYLNASNKIYQVHLVMGTSFLLKTIAGLYLALAWNSYLCLPATFSAFSIAELLLLRRLFYHQFPAYQKIRSAEATKELRSRAKYALCHKVSGLVYYQSDMVILSLAASVAVINVYAKFQYLALGILGICGAAFTSLTATIARRQIGAAQATRTRQYRYVSLACHFAAGSFALAYFFTSNDIVSLLYRTASGTNSFTISLFSLLLYLNVVKSVDDTFIAAKGAFEVAFYLPLIEPIFYLLLALFTVHLWNIDGILAAGIVTNVVFAGVGKAGVVAKAVLHQTIRKLLQLRGINFLISLVLITPLYFLYSASRAWHLSPLARFGTCNLACALYIAAVCSLLISRGYPKASPATPDLLNTEEKLAA
jgi:O-antigen/teichoic acid export membrane protein